MGHNGGNHCFGRNLNVENRNCRKVRWIHLNISELFFRVFLEFLMNLAQCVNGWKRKNVYEVVTNFIKSIKSRYNL